MILSDAPIDFDSLLRPIDGGAGRDMRFTATYNAILEARREDDPRLPQGIWTRDVKRADWPMVERLCTDILTTQSKDLQVACWLAEAVLHRMGFPGLGPGLHLLDALCRRFWPTLHPEIDDGDIAPRKAPFEWLNVRFPTVLRNMPVVHCIDDPEIAYTWTDFVNAQLLEGLRQRDPKSVERSINAGAISLTDFTAARERTAIGFWQSMNASLHAALDDLAALNATLEELCGGEAPGLGAIGGAVRDLLSMTQIARSTRQPPAAAPVQRAAQAFAPLPPIVVSSAAINDRADAYRLLAEVADRLQQLEPHSPVPYLIRRAVAWGDKSFGELMMVFAAANLDIAAVLEMLGLPSPADVTTDVASSD